MIDLTNRSPLFGFFPALVAAALVDPTPMRAQPASSPAAATSADVQLSVFTARKSAQPITKYITGKFVEHLGSNIYNGMCAEILRNPTFADYPFWTGSQTPDGRLRLIEKEADIVNSIRGQARRMDAPRDAIDSLVDARHDALAHGWIKVGPREAVRTSPDSGQFGGRAQRVEISAAGQGIAQWTHLPLHRVRQYGYELVVRSPDLHSLHLALAAGEESQPGAEDTVTKIGPAWASIKGTITLAADAPADAAYKLSLTAPGPGQFVIARMLLWPADHVMGADPDIIRLLKEAHVPLLRWPGGNFVSAYHWKDGVGPMNERPTRPNEAWGMVEPNLFGTDEFMAFCKAVGAEPMICINGGDGTPEEAAQWVQYCNGPASSPMGARRAANGHPHPYQVKIWEAGNELWGQWQVNWTTPHGYADRFRQFAPLLLKADPTMTLYACGAPVLWGHDWNAALIDSCADILQRTTDHPLIGGDVAPSAEPIDVYRNFMAVPEILEKEWNILREQMLKAGVREPHLGITELQMFAHIGSNNGSQAAKLNFGNLVNPGTQGEALYDTLMYHTAVRLAPFVDLVTHSAVVNHGGGLRKERERVYANPCHYAQAAFAAFQGATPVALECASPIETAPVVLPDINKKGNQVSYGTVSALAAVATNGDLLISLVHRGTAGPVTMNIDLQDFAAAGQAQVWSLSADVPWAANTLRNPQAIQPTITESKVVRGTLAVTMKPYTLVRVRILHAPAP